MKYVIPILSLIISIIALAVALPRPNNLGIDYLGIIVAIISLATAFAVGFQIWNALSLETRLKELKGKIEADNKAQLEVSEKKLKADYDNKVAILHLVNAFYGFEYSANLLMNDKNYSRAFFNHMRALDVKIKLQKLGFDVCIDNYEETFQPFIYSFPVSISDPDKQKFIIETIINSKNEKLIDMIVDIKSRIFQSEV